MACGGSNRSKNSASTHHSFPRNGKSYEDRYDSLQDAFGNNPGLWYDTTSFYLMNSVEDTYSLTDRLTLGAAHDMLILFGHSDMCAAYFGNVGSADVLMSFFPRARKIGSTSAGMPLWRKWESQS